MEQITKALISASGYTNNKLKCTREFTMHPEMPSIDQDEIVQRDIINAMANHIGREKLEWSYFVDKWNFSATWKAACWVFTDQEMDNMVKYLILHIKRMEALDDKVYRV